MPIKKTKRVSLVEQVVVQIENLIESGHWKVGEKIPPELDLMDKFDVSRNTLREAIRALVYTGLLETRQGSGTIVKSNNALGVAIHKHIANSTLIDILEVRLALEKEAAILAAERRTNDDLNTMERYIHKCIEAIENNDSAQFIKADFQFHKAVIQASRNCLLMDLYDHITEAVQTSIANIIERHLFVTSEIQAHEELFNAIELQDPIEALKHCNAYIDTIKKNITSN